MKTAAQTEAETMTFDSCLAKIQWLRKQLGHIADAEVKRDEQMAYAKLSGAYSQFWSPSSAIAFRLSKKGEYTRELARLESLLPLTVD